MNLNLYLTPGICNDVYIDIWLVHVSKLHCPIYKLPVKKWRGGGAWIPTVLTVLALK